MSNFIFYVLFIYNPKLTGAMSFHLVPHLPRFVAIAAKFFMCERKLCISTNFLVTLSLFYSFLIFTNSQCKQHKMLKSDPQYNVVI